MMWRTIVYERLSVLIGEEDIKDVSSAGSLEGMVLEKPFLVIRMGNATVELEDDNEPKATSSLCEIWVHDEPGSYVRIDRILELVRSSMTAPFTAGNAVQCIWQGDSPELPDDLLGTIVRYSSYRMVGTEQ